jgi:site-specific DNA recombinase
MAFAELERSQIKDRVMTGKREKARQGGYNGARCPLGYRYDGHIWEIDDAGAATVRTAFDRFLTGATLTAIAQELNDAGAQTARGGRWHPSTVRYILTNGFYAGLSQWDGIEETPPGNWPPIIEAQTYHAAQQRLNTL